MLACLTGGRRKGGGVSGSRRLDPTDAGTSTGCGEEWEVCPENKPWKKHSCSPRFQRTAGSDTPWPHSPSRLQSSGSASCGPNLPAARRAGRPGDAFPCTEWQHRRSWSRFKNKSVPEPALYKAGQLTRKDRHRKHKAKELQKQLWGQHF